MITTDTIKSLVADHFDLPVEAIDLPTRKREVVIARQVAHYLAYKYIGDAHKGGLSMIQIGEQIGGRDRTTVIHSIKVVEQTQDTYKDFFMEMRFLDACFTMTNIPQY